MSDPIEVAEEDDCTDSVSFDFKPSKDRRLYVLKVDSSIPMTYEDFLAALGAFVKDEEERIRRVRQGIEGH